MAFTASHNYYYDVVENPIRVNRRLFDPADNLCGRSLRQLTQLLYRDIESGTTKLLYHVPYDNRQEIHESSLVVSVDGACRSNGYLGARASYGVFFASNSSLNCKGLLPTNMRQTNQVAELYALSQALDTIKHSVLPNMGIDTVVIRTDSTYVANGLTQWVYDWEQNGWLRSGGQSIINGDMFHALHEQVLGMEADGITVSFWRVGREWNQGADRLANEAFHRF